MTLKIYGIARSRASRALWMAEELGIPYEHVTTGIADGGTAAPEFRALNPNGRIPTIDDDGVVVWESGAINLHLAKRHGGPLAPRDAAEDAHMTMWSFWAVTELEPDAHEVYVHTITRPPAERDPAVAAAALDRLKRPLGALAVALERGGGHLVGGRFTVADLNVVAVAYYLRGVTDPFAAWPGVAAWYAAATQRPGFLAMVKLRERGP
jgi:glutathione S-transferase